MFINVEALKEMKYTMQNQTSQRLIVLEVKLL